VTLDGDHHLPYFSVDSRLNITSVEVYYPSGRIVRLVQSGMSRNPLSRQGMLLTYSGTETFDFAEVVRRLGNDGASCIISVGRDDSNSRQLCYEVFALGGGQLQLGYLTPGRYSVDGVEPTLVRVLSRHPVVWDYVNSSGVLVHAGVDRPQPVGPPFEFSDVWETGEPFPLRVVPDWTTVVDHEGFFSLVRKLVRSNVVSWNCPSPSGRAALALGGEAAPTRLDTAGEFQSTRGGVWRATGSVRVLRCPGHGGLGRRRPGVRRRWC
jgi:hypothetical protein